MTYMQAATLLESKRNKAMNSCENSISLYMRTDETNFAMETGFLMLKKYRDVVGATDRNIAVIDYLVKHTRAVVVFDPNVYDAWVRMEQACFHAEEMMRFGA